MLVDLGSRAPNFILPDQNGKLFNLSEHLGSKNIVLYFYPKNETPGCIAEACEFRNNISEFENHNCLVVGISADSEKSHSKFINHYNLPFTLLSDRKNKVRKLYQVKPSLLGLLPGRKTFVISAEGIIKYVFDYQFEARKHVVESLKSLANE